MPTLGSVDYAQGTITEHRRNLEFAVRLDGGREIVAILPRRRLKRLGCLFGSLAGWKATVALHVTKQPAIVELKQPEDE